MAIKRVEAHAEISDELRKALAEAIKSENADAVEKVLEQALERGLKLAQDADQLEGHLSTATQQLQGKGAKVLSKEVQALVNEKVKAGLPYDDAVVVALRQIEHDENQKSKK